MKNSLLFFFLPLGVLVVVFVVVVVVNIDSFVFLLCCLKNMVSGHLKLFPY